MHFTFWSSLRANEGAYAEISWTQFVAFVRAPTISASKNALEGWSPASFRGNRRAKANVEAVSCIVLDDDASGLSTDALAELWSGSGALVHTSFSHTPETPKHRITVPCSRDMSTEEHAVVWRELVTYAAKRGQVLDEATKDPSRLWFVPAHQPDAPYDVRELGGAPLDVDAVLAGASAVVKVTAPAPTVAPAGDARKAMAAALGAAWPDKGRHGAQLALAGALRGEGWPEADAVDFLCDVCRAAGDEDHPKRLATVRHTYASGAALTGWTRLKTHVEPVIVEAARIALGRDASWVEAAERRVERRPDALPAPPEGRFAFRTGGLNMPLPPLRYQVDGLIARGDVVMLVAHGNSLKTWLAFSLALAVASGRPWLGRFPVEQGTAGIIDFESGAYEVDRRLQMLGARDEAVGDRLLRTSYPAARLTDPEAWLELAQLKGDMWIVDSFAASTSGIDENDTRADQPLQHAARIAESSGCTVVFIHHARKSNGGTDRREAVRGSSAIYAACDRVFEFTDLEKKPGGVVLSTMVSIKDGAGHTPEPVRVELSDAGMRWVEIEKTSPTAEDKIREQILLKLKDNTTGIQIADLKSLVPGKTETKAAVLAQLKERQITHSFKDGRGQMVMLKPGVTWEKIAEIYGLGRPT